MTDQPPLTTASEADAGRFPRVTRPSRAAVVAAVGIVGALVLAYLVGEVLAIFVIGLILAYLLEQARGRPGAEPEPRGRAHGFAGQAARINRPA